MSIQGQVLRVHEAIYKGTDGRVGHKMIGVPTLLLRTTGRRSGATRTNGLVYARDGDDYLLVASNGGADKPPAWLHNVRADPTVEVQVGRERRPASAHIVEPGNPDYDRLYGLFANELDPTKRISRYADVAKFAADEVIFLPLYYSSGSATTTFRRGITGPTAVLPTQPVTTWNMHEWDIA